MNLDFQGRIEQELEKIKKSVHRTERFTRRHNLADDPEEQEAYLDAIAFNLLDFYMGVERIFSRIAQNLDRSTPQGSQWHQELLKQMEQSIPGTRNAVITNKSLKDELDNLRGFRHVAHNIYTHELQPSRVLELAKQLPDCLSSPRRRYTEVLSVI